MLFLAVLAKSNEETVTFLAVSAETAGIDYFLRFLAVCDAAVVGLSAVSCCFGIPGIHLGRAHWKSEESQE